MLIKKSHIMMVLLLSLFNLVCIQPVTAADEAVASGYRIGPGDLLRIAVWKEEDLQKDVLVKPDGALTFPLVGEVAAAGLTTQGLTDLIKSRLRKFIPAAVVTVSVLQSTSNKIYVVGKVVRPGEYKATSYMDVLQAISLSGGLTPFADSDEIKIMRRTGDTTKVFLFDYDDVTEGESLEMNILLQAGDTIVVP